MIYSNFYVLLVIKIIKKVICFFFAIQMLNSFQFIASSYAMESDAIQISQRLESLMEETARNTIIRLAFIKDNPSDFAQFMQDNLDSLATEDTFSIVRGLYTYYFVTSDLKNTIESSPWYPQYQPFLERYISHDNTVIRQMTSLVRAATLGKQTRYQITQNDMYEEAETLLHEVKKSEYPFLRYVAYITLKSTVETLGKLNQALVILKEGLSTLPDPYSFQFCNYGDSSIYLSDERFKKEHVTLRRDYLNRRIRQSEGKEKIKEQITFAALLKDPNYKGTEFYRPLASLKVYQILIRDAEVVRTAGVDLSEIYLNFAILCSMPGPLQNIEQSKLAYKWIVNHKDEINPENYKSALINFLNYLVYGNDHVDQRRGYDLIMSSLRAVPSSEKWMIEIMNKKLFYLYQYGPEGIKDHEKLLTLLKDKLKTEPKDSNSRFTYLDSLANLYLYGDEIVRNTRKSINIYENIKKIKTVKKNSLLSLIFIYKYQEGYKDISKAVEYHWELAELLRDTPDQRLIQLKELRSVFAVRERFNQAELRRVTQLLLDETADETEREAHRVFQETAERDRLNYLRELRSRSGARETFDRVELRRVTQLLLDETADETEREAHRVFQETAERDRLNYLRELQSRSGARETFDQTELRRVTQLLLDETADEAEREAHLVFQETAEREHEDFVQRMRESETSEFGIYNYHHDLYGGTTQGVFQGTTEQGRENSAQRMRESETSQFGIYNYHHDLYGGTI